MANTLSLQNNIINTNKTHTVRARSFICVLKAPSSDGSTSSGNAIQSHHLPKIELDLYINYILVYEHEYLLLYPTDTGFHASKSSDCFDTL